MQASLNTRSVFILSITVVVLAIVALADSAGALREWLLYRAAAAGDNAAAASLTETLRREATEETPGYGRLVRVVHRQSGDLVPVFQSQLDHALLLAAANGHGETMAILLDAGADLDARDAEGRGVLWWAVAGGHPRLAASLAARGLALRPAEARSEYLSAALIQGAREADAAALMALLPFLEADSLNTPYLGRLALVEAAAAGHGPAVSLLLEYGADPSSRDTRGRDAFDAAGINGRLEVVRLLESYRTARETLVPEATPEPAPEGATPEAPAP